MTCTPNSSRIVPRKSALNAKCSSESFARVGIPSGGSPPLTSQRLIGVSSYSLAATQNSEWRTATRTSLLIVGRSRQPSPSKQRPTRLLRSSKSVRPVSTRAPTSRSTAACKERHVEKAWSYTTPDTHLFANATNNTAGGIPLSSRWVRYNRQKCTMVLCNFQGGGETADFEKWRHVAGVSLEVFYMKTKTGQGRGQQQ